MQLNNRNGTNVLIIFISLISWWFTANVIKPELHYFLQQSAFLTDRLFFQGFTRYPGGIADYVSEFIAQFFYFKVFGSFLIILVASLQGIIAIDLIQRISGKTKLNFSVFSFILLLAVLIQCNYFYPFYAIIRLLLAFGFVWIFTALTSNYPRFRFYFCFFLALLIFYVAGGAALIVFASSAILVQIRFSTSNSDFLILPVFAVFACTLPFIAYKYFFLVDLSLVYSISHSKTPMITSYIPDYKLYALYAILPFYILCAVLVSRLKKNPGEISSGLNPDSPKLKTWNSPITWLVVQFTFLAILGIFSLNFTFDKETRDQKLVSFYGANGDWENVIKTAKNLKDYDLFANVEYNKALANTGKLAENLFNYPQLAGSAGLFLDGKVTSDVPFICSDQYYDLGFMHESQHWTFEAQTIFPNSPRLMKRLVQINLVTGKYKLAEKFLNRLDENMLYHDWVAKYRKYINDTSLVAKDQEFSWKRKCEPTEAFTASSHVPKLIKLLEANHSNRMAYEYLLCSALLDGDLGIFANELSSGKNISNYPLPRSWDEALILYYYVAGKVPATDDIQCTKDGQERFISFIKAMKPFGNDWQLAKQSLQKEYGTTYWYYLKCLSPKVTKAQIKRQKFDE